MRRLLLMALLVVGTMGEQRGTLAYLTATAASGANTFVAGKVDLTLGSTAGLITFTGMYPGAATYGTLTIQNSGTVSMRYAIKDELVAGGDAALASALQLTVRERGAGSPTCDAAGFGSYGTTLYGPAALVPAGGKIVGDTATGSQTGDRTLAPASIDTMCFQVSLPSTAATTLQNVTADVKFTFVAEQLSGT